MFNFLKWRLNGIDATLSLNTYSIKFMINKRTINGNKMKNNKNIKENNKTVEMTKFLAVLFAICSGLAIGNLYWAGSNNEWFWTARRKWRIPDYCNPNRICNRNSAHFASGGFPSEKKTDKHGNGLVCNRADILCALPFIYDIVTIIIQHGHRHNLRSDHTASCR